ncbi:hypothetical protein J437_LFUL013703 [Ladona fulva]|uniref:Inorganic phosphate cotransporter n=1 Tax=Ladona fulva TaxID=123851 RepID=A0A8K0KES4_LADFU|nr:hypothetical protein J437_LFUL013703 [Ladona fulva]
MRSIRLLSSKGLLGWWGYRHTIALMSFWAVAVSYAQRVGLSLVIVAMNDWNSTQKTDSEYLGWSEDHVHTILSSFFWGYIITQGVIYPALHVLFSRWVPTEERGRLAPFAYAGAQFGTVIAMPICGWLSSTKGAGWPSTFYLFGGIGLLWTISWILFASSSPEDHRWISVREKDYILKSLGKHRQQVRSENKHLSTPWKEIWTSLPVWAIILANCGQNWGFCTLLTEMPTYMSAVLHFNLNEVVLMGNDI